MLPCNVSGESGAGHTGGGQGSVTACRQEEIAIDLVIPLQCRRLTGTCQGPKLLTPFQDTCGLQLETGDVCEVAVELQDFARLDDLVALGDDRKGVLGIGTVEHLLFVEGVDTPEVSGAFRHETDRCFLDGPVHSGRFLPDFKGLLFGEAVAEAVPGFCADVGYLLDEMSHGIFLSVKWTHAIVQL